MTDEELARTLATHTQKIESLEHRVKDVEKIVDSVHLLAQEMVRMTAELQNMNRSIDRLNDDVAGIKSKPAKRWELIVTTLISAAIGYFISTL